MISASDGQALLALARDSIRALFRAREPDTAGAGHLTQKLGVFVTLRKKGQLRGCMGIVEPNTGLWRATVQAAQSAARDPRFFPLEKHELPEVEIEVSVLSEPVPLTAENPDEYPGQVVIGRHGLILQSSRDSGLLLPQVAVEQGWDAKGFLENIGVKAGLSKEAYRDRKNRLCVFEAQIFTEG